MKNYLKNTFLIVIVITMMSCNNTLLPIRIPVKDPAIPVNDIEKDIPRYPNNKVFVFYKYAKQKQKQLKLSVPENGFDSLMLRIWFVYPNNLFQYGEMLEVKFTPEAEPVASYTKMEIFFNPTRDYENIDAHRDSVILQPQNGWADFKEKLNSLHIMTMPSIEHTPLYRERSGGGIDYNNNNMTVAIEIATKGQYRFIQYNNFEKHKDIYEVGKMYDFIRYLREEFGMREISDEWYGK